VTTGHFAFEMHFGRIFVLYIHMLIHDQFKKMNNLKTAGHDEILTNLPKILLYRF